VGQGGRCHHVAHTHIAKGAGYENTYGRLAKKRFKDLGVSKIFSITCARITDPQRGSTNTPLQMIAAQSCKVMGSR